MEKLNESIFAIEKDTKNNRKLIGYVTAKTVLEKTTQRKRYEFQEIPVEETIGVYKKQPVLKKGDTIITKSNNNKYLLSSQIIINQDNTNPDEYGFIYPDGSFYIVDRTVNSNKNPTLDTKNAIGYIAFSEDFVGGEKVKSNFKFTEFVCDTVISEKFLKFCDWQICKMINTANVFDLSLQDYSKDIQKDINLNFEIAGSKFKDILVNISSDVLDLFFYNKVKSLGKDMQNSNIEKALGIDSKTTVYSYFLHFICKSNNDICNAITSCALSYYKATHPDDNLNASISDYIKNLYRSDDAKAREKSLERTFSLCLKFLRDCIDGLPVGLKLKIFKQYYPYYIAGKNIIELGEITGFLLANVSIKFSVEPEYMEYLKYGIDNATKQKPILEKCKKEYEQKFKSATGNCLEYMKLLYSLKSGDFERQCGHNELQGITDLMKKYVFGNEQIGACKVLDNYVPGVKSEEKKQPIQDINPKRIAIFVHGTISKPAMWTENDKTVTTLLEIVNTQRSDAKFNWENLAKLDNDYNDRKQASELLINYMQQFRGQYEEIVFITHSHGGNVALQAIDKLNGFKKIFLLSLTSPAYNCDSVRSSTNKIVGYSDLYDNELGRTLKIPIYEKEKNMENPANIRNLYKHINISKKYDFVSGEASRITDKSCTSDDEYNNNRTVDILINCDTPIIKGTFGHSIQQSTDCLEIIKQKVSIYFHDN
jgi:hypothetical protein